MDVNDCKDAADGYWYRHGHDSADALQERQIQSSYDAMQAYKDARNNRSNNAREHENLTRMAHAGVALIGETEALFDAVYDPDAYCASIGAARGSAPKVVEQLRDKLIRSSLSTAFNPLKDEEIAEIIKPTTHLLAEQFVKRAKCAAIEQSLGHASGGA